MAASVGRLGRTERRQLGWFGIGLVAAGLAPLALLVRRPDAARGELAVLGPPALGTPLAVALHVSSDTLIALSYFAISAVLLYVVVRARRDIPFSGVLVAFGAFIVACGTGHLMHVVAQFNPTGYWLLAGVQAATVAASVATALALPPLVPRLLEVVAGARLAVQRKQELEVANLALGRELTERQRAAAEARRQYEAAEQARNEMRAVLDAVNEAIVYVSPEGRVLSINRSVTELLGLDRADVLGRSFGELTPQLERVFGGARAIPALLTDTATDDRRHVTTDVRQVWPYDRDLTLTTAPVPGPDGRGLGHVYVLRDVTQEREVNRLRAERQQSLEAEMTRAAQLQADLLPHEVPAVAGLEVAARCLPARQVGGDFFDWHQPTPGVLTLTLGDVMGKGLAAALLMATVRAALATADGRSAPGQTLEAVAAATHLVLERAGAFVTMFHARAEAATPRVTYADAGHGHAFVHRAGGAVERLPTRGLPLGAFLGQQYAAGAVDLAPGDALIVYSDGLIDARPDLALGPEALGARLEGTGSASEIVERLTALADSGDDLPDDLTVIVLRRRAPETA